MRDLTLTLQLALGLGHASAVMAGPDDGITRPFLHDMGRGLLLMSASQGPDAILEPDGVFKSTDEGRTWQPIPGLQVKSFAPQSLLRLRDGNLLGVSRATVRYEREPGVHIGMSCRFDARTESFRRYESIIRVQHEPGEDLGVSSHHHRRGGLQLHRHPGGPARSRAALRARCARTAGALRGRGGLVRSRIVPVRRPNEFRIAPVIMAGPPWPARSGPCEDATQVNRGKIRG